MDKKSVLILKIIGSDAKVVFRAWKQEERGVRSDK